MAFITFEGIEGSGKSTQARRLAELLGPEVLLTHEPGGTALGRDIRGLLLNGGSIQPVAEVLLFFADRAQHVAEIVRPALLAGRTVISDRYVDSSLAYQGYGRGLSLVALRAVALLATGGLTPDVTVLLDLPVEEGLTRVNERGGHDRLESERREFHQQVRSGYLSMAEDEPARWVVVDGSGDPETVGHRVDQSLQGRAIRFGYGFR